LKLVKLNLLGVHLSLRDISHRVRKSLGLTHDQFAAALEVASSSIGNWESGRKRPAPKNLKKMARLAPEFAHEIDMELKAFEWHQGSIVAEEPSWFAQLPVDVQEQAVYIAVKHKLDTSVILVEALRTGLTALSRGSSTDLKTLVKRQADIAKRVTDREHPADSSRKRPRSKIA
jgi:transcriptional regulator with XRE-family HTH domain